MAAGFFGRHPGVRNNDDHIAYLYEPGGGAVEADYAATAFAANGIGFEPGAVVVVDDLHLFAFYDVGRFQQLFVDGDAADIVQIGLRDAHAVNFTLENFNKHGQFLQRIVTNKTAEGQFRLQR